MSWNKESLLMINDSNGLVKKYHKIPHLMSLIELKTDFPIGQEISVLGTATIFSSVPIMFSSVCAKDFHYSEPEIDLESFEIVRFMVQDSGIFRFSGDCWAMTHCQGSIYYPAMRDRNKYYTRAYQQRMAWIEPVVNKGPEVEVVEGYGEMMK